MNVITVIPLSRSRTVGELSYFTASDVPVGAVVSVPLRSKTVHAIVIDSKPAAEMKSDIKQASYQMKKLGKVRAAAFFPAPFMETAKMLADYYAAGIGAIVGALVSDSLLENASKIAPPLVPAHASKDMAFAVQGDDADRVSSWRSLIRQEFARKRSVAFYVPTIEDGRALHAALTKGIEGYIFFLNGSLTPKKAAETWKAIAGSDHPVVVIATGSFSVLPRSDIDTVVIERENGRGWINQKSPYLDIRHALEALARRNRQTLYIADSMLRTETLHRLDEQELDQGSPFKWRSVSTAKDSLIDMKRQQEERNKGQQEEKKEDAEGKESAKEKKFRVLSPELEDLIRKVKEENSHLFIFTVRRGLATATVCDDCETIVLCKSCSAPVVLHTSKESGKNFFMCHKCGARRSADEACAACGGWRLTPLGIGIDRVAEELAARFPDIDIFKIDADTAKTEKQVAIALDRFKAHPGSILLGTEMALLHLSEKVEHVAVASLDSLFALPDFRIQEKIMYSLIRLRSIAARSILVQTRKAEEKVFEYGLKGNLSDFCRSALDERKRFSYPPFSILIKITLEGKRDAIANDMAAFAKLLEPHEVDVFPAFTSTVRGSSVIHGLIKIRPEMWPDRELLAKLRALPPHASVKVNPESLL